MYDLQSYLQLCQITGIKVDDNYLNFLPSFLEFIDKMDADIKQHRIRKLVVDMRYNGGGNSMLGDQLLQYLGLIRTVYQNIRHLSENQIFFSNICLISMIAVKVNQENLFRWKIVKTCHSFPK